MNKERICLECGKPLTNEFHVSFCSALCYRKNEKKQLKECDK